MCIHVYTCVYTCIYMCIDIVVELVQLSLDLCYDIMYGLPVSLIFPDSAHHNEVSLPASASSSAAGTSAVKLADPNSKDAHTAMLPTTRLQKSSQTRTERIPILLPTRLQGWQTRRARMLILSTTRLQRQTLHSAIIPRSWQLGKL